MFKVAYISRATLFSSPGGDTKQLEMTAQELRLMGVEVDVLLTNQAIDYAKYDLLHFFNIIRPADILVHIKKSKKPFVVSTIFVEYGSVTDKRVTAMGMLKKLVPEDTLEYLKVIARAVKNGEKITSWRYLISGHRQSIKYIAQRAACLLPNSKSEYSRFSKKYNITQKYMVVPNGIDTHLLKKEYGSNEQYTGAILCMARIEPRKNQLNLIRALNNTAFSLYIHGEPSPNNMSYYELCKNAAAENVHVLGWLKEKELYSAYSNAKVHVLPSYFETTGLSSLEAAVMGCNIVITDRGDTRDYFGDNAWYCDPDDPDSIKSAIEKAHAAPYNNQFREHILQHYTWQQAAVATLAAYKQVLLPGAG